MDEPVSLPAPSGLSSLSLALTTPVVAEIPVGRVDFYAKYLGRTIPVFLSMDGSISRFMTEREARREGLRYGTIVIASGDHVGTWVQRYVPESMKKMRFLYWEGYISVSQYRERLATFQCKLEARKAANVH